MILGAHMSIAGGFAQAALKTGKDFQANAMQIFTKSPRSRLVKPVDPTDAEQFKKYCQEYKIEYVIAHSSYLLNFGLPISQATWMLNDIKTDFERLNMLGGVGVVVHMGKCLGGDRKIAIHNIVENAKKVIEATKHTPLQYILENTAGQGSEIGYELEELGEVWKGLRGFSPRLRACLDTAHIWGAGYDIGTASGAEKTMKIYDELIGVKLLSCFHFNDSKKPLGSHLDRHENIGDGFIDLEGITVLAKFAVKHQIPMILETPEDEAILKAMARKRPAPVQTNLLGEPDEKPVKPGKTHIDDLKTVRQILA